MRIRTFVTTATAAAVALLAALAPSAHALGPIEEVIVGGASSPATSIPLEGAFELPLTVTIATLFGPLTFGCDGGTPTGRVNRGSASTTPSPLSPNPAFEFTDLGLDCDTPIGGNITFTVTCNLEVIMNDSVTSGVDTAVRGTLHVTSPGTTTHCISGSWPGGCTFKVGGSTPVVFDETIKTLGGINYQELAATGSGLQVKNVSGCLGVMSNNNAISLNSVAVNLRTTATFQAINFSD